MTRSSHWPPEGAVLPERHPDAPAPGTKLRKHFAGCFGCGDESPNGLGLRFTVDDGLALHGQFHVTEAHQGAPGLAHGGVLTAALDETLGTLNVLTFTPAVTGRLETDFMRPMPVEHTLYLSAWIDGMDGRKIYSSGMGRLDEEDGPEVVRVRGLFIAVGLEHFEKHGRPHPGAGRPDGVIDLNP
jgi:hypothetical protein